MAESAQNGSENGRGREGGEGEEADYMGDLSLLLPPEASEPPKSSARKIPNDKPMTVQPPKKKSKLLSWQEQRKLERERKQQEEDEQTLANIEAPIPQSNIGFKLLQQMGYTPGSALGKEGSGRAEPVGLEIRRSRAGIGREDPHKEKKKQEEFMVERKTRKEESLMADFGSRQKSQWRTRRVVINYHKAKAALDQLENKEVLEPEKNDEDQECEQDEEEEEVITEEDLLMILTKLREEHNYCLFCGCQYESKEELLSYCPGTDEDDH
ncbi:G patch domain-containing protein 11 [Punica granatum]|uniref:Uncharacterized protein n=2 Tax=Punica granatum TaxID=22663 RepID=A0A2I0IFV8_PUNGR|nr:G patch domain-containing protein 11 [Punica granatum]PKI42872.1 hypothetical protein CRG98_036670 [Punica granatum]